MDPFCQRPADSRQNPNGHLLRKISLGILLTANEQPAEKINCNEFQTTENADHRRAADRGAGSRWANAGLQRCQPSLGKESLFVRDRY